MRLLWGVGVSWNHTADRGRTDPRVRTGALLVAEGDAPKLGDFGGVRGVNAHLDGPVESRFRCCSDLGCGRTRRSRPPPRRGR